MAKKTLLSEGNIRKFMKLAAIEPLTENFLAEAELEEEEKMDEAGCGSGSMEEEMMAEADDADDDMGGMPEEGKPAADMVPVDAFLKALEAALEEATGQPVDVSSVEPEDGMGDMGDEGEEGEEGEGDMGDMEEGMYTEEDDAMYEELNESVQVVDTGAMVKEVSRRVAQRLLKESKQEQLAEALAAKIAAKLG